ncbi:RAD55 family ATPase [Halopenitus sp. H-Gu1]|uniref:RAD55 family ATPase n=1 Tax=Halopenitus sp. H-Gu1 TaxID=3242697 RepID=UPI00359EB137
MDRLPTGISVLDRELGGGIPSGSIVVLTAQPASQAELFLYELTAARGTLYLTTIRSEEAVRDGLDRTTTRIGSPTIRDIGGDTALDLDHANDLIGTLPEEANLIIDAVDPLERHETSRYRRFLNSLQTHMINTGSVAVIHAMKGQTIPDNRDLTEHVADVVFDLHTEITTNEVVNRLAVPKFRGGVALEEPVKLKLAESVTIDTSRDIA